MNATTATERQTLKELARRVLDRIDRSSRVPNGSGDDTSLCEDHLERKRDAAAGQAWDRLQAVFLRAGQPDSWITRNFRASEGAVEHLWISARQSPEDDARFYEELLRWEQVAVAAITGAAAKEAREEEGD